MTNATAHTAEDNANVDAIEVEKFDRLASRWWDPEGEFKPLHDLNPIRCNFIDGAVPVAEKALLDIGCGGGILSEGLAQRGATVTGIDMAQGPLEVAKLHAKANNLNIHYQASTAEQYALSHSEAFDVVTCLEMLEHVPDPSSVLSACEKLLKPGGHCFISTLNRTPKAYALAVLGAEYVLKWLPKGTHDYQKFIRPSELAQWARQCGLTVCDIQGMVYNPLSKRFSLSQKDVAVNYIVHLRKATEA